MNYTLYHQDQMIGKVTLVEQDFPNLFGVYELHQLAEENPIAEYINYSVKANKLMNEDEAKWIEFAEKEELKFIDLIESDDWKLVDEIGNTHKIMIPNFGDNQP